MKTKTEKQRAISDELCRRGSIRHLLTSPQKKLYDIFKSNVFNEVGLYSARKMGKSFASFLIAFEFCWANPGALVRIILPELKQGRDIYTPIYQELIDILPTDLMPVHMKSETAFVFQNGAQIRIGGSAPQNIESSRGPRCDLLFLDEVAAFEERNYDYATRSVLFPQLTTTKGKIVYLTTPARSPSHPWIVDTMPILISKGALVTATIDDNPLLDDEGRAIIVERYGSVDNPNYRREYLCELIADDDWKIVPEFNRSHVVDEDALPQEKDTFGLYTPYIGYQALDYGEVDLSALLSAVYDHNTQTLYVIDEWIDNGSPEKVVDQLQYSTAHVLYKCCQVETVMDVMPHMAGVFRRNYGLTFNLPSKGRLEDQVSLLRSSFERGKLKIHSNCKGLIAQLETGVWDSNKKQFERTSKGHSDAIAALAYLVKFVKWNRRPGLSGNENIQIGMQENVVSTKPKNENHFTDRRNVVRRKFL